MIALLLATQIIGAIPANPHVQSFAAPATTGPSEIIRQLPPKAACKNDLGRLEVHFATPAALYRQGDRPPKPLKNWVDYPDGVVCQVGDAK
ncbi:MAG: hypothetical protein ACXU8S_06845 [Phenylobacterium sp.]